MVFAGVALVLVSVGLVFADVQEAGNAVPAAPKDRALTLTVPSMKRVKDVPVYGGPAQDETALHNGTLHVNDTGFPWEREAKVLLEDSEGTRYVYRVFDRRIVGPDDVSVKEPIEGKNIVSLQTCTLPDYKDRLVVQAELVKTAKARVEQAKVG
jgi:sortase A